MTQIQNNILGPTSNILGIFTYTGASAYFSSATADLSTLSTSIVSDFPLDEDSVLAGGFGVTVKSIFNTLNPVANFLNKILPGEFTFSMFAQTSMLTFKLILPDFSINNVNFTETGIEATILTGNGVPPAGSSTGVTLSTTFTMLRSDAPLSFICSVGVAVPADLSFSVSMLGTWHSMIYFLNFSYGLRCIRNQKFVFFGCCRLSYFNTYTSIFGWIFDSWNYWI